MNSLAYCFFVVGLLTNYTFSMQYPQSTNCHKSTERTYLLQTLREEDDFIVVEELPNCKKLPHELQRALLLFLLPLSYEWRMLVRYSTLTPEFAESLSKVLHDYIVQEVPQFSSASVVKRERFEKQLTRLMRFIPKKSNKTVFMEQRTLFKANAQLLTDALLKYFLTYVPDVILPSQVDSPAHVTTWLYVVLVSAKHGKNFMFSPRIHSHIPLALHQQLLNSQRTGFSLPTPSEQCLIVGCNACMAAWQVLEACGQIASAIQFANAFS